MNQLNLYYIFYTVAQCGNISAAAKKLFISQPAVSKSISKLEENYTSPLLTRTSKGVKLTESGELLFAQLDTAFSAIRQGEELLKHNESMGVGKLSIGVSTTLCKYVLLPYLQDFITRYPHVKISISCQSTHETLAAIENGTLDIGLVGDCDRLKDSKLDFKPIREIEDIFVCSPEYLEKLNVDSDQLLTQATFLLLDQNNVTRRFLDDCLLQRGIRLENQLEVTTMDLLIEFAKIGLGVACVIGNFVEKEIQDGSLKKIIIKEPLPSRSIGFVSAKGTKPSKPMEHFLENIM